MNEKKRERTIVFTSIIGILGNIVLVATKATIGFIVGSIAIVMDALNNLTDALSSVITIIGTKISNKKPDRKHPYGHGRVEYITSTLIAALILFAGGTAIYQSIVSIIGYFKTGAKPDYSVVALIIISIAILGKVAIGLFFKIQAKKTNSDVLRASGTDALWDSVLSSATLVGAIFAYTLGWYVEGYLGIAIGLFIIRSGILVLKDAISNIVGQRADEEEVKAVLADINSVPGVKGAYDLILNSYGHKKNIGSVHVLVDGNLKATEIQKIERNIMSLIYMKHNTIMTVGIYAENNDSPLSKRILKSLSFYIKKYSQIMQLHGFFVDEETNICNFDLVISFDEKEPEKIIKEISSALKIEYPNLDFIITLDRDYTLS